MRIVFAVLVLLSHAPEITDGNSSRELFQRLTGSPMTFGSFGVDGFFLLSGFLIVQSWDRDPELLNFLRKRVLRIVPGYAVAVLLSTVVVGWLAPGVPHFFRHLGGQYWSSVLLLSSPLTPRVFPGFAYPYVNGSLWTIPYEFRCYLLVAFAGMCGLLRRRALWAWLVVVLFGFTFFPAAEEHMSWRHLHLYVGELPQDVRLTGTFLVGSCFYLYRNEIRFRQVFLWTAIAILVGAGVAAPQQLEVALVLCGGYLLFYLAQGPFAITRSFPDISYGLYLYGWPAEAMWAWYRRGSPWINFVASTLVCVLLGWCSWHMVERPMLKLKRRATAALPPP